MPWADNSSDRQQVGATGEALAVRHLIAAGYTIVEKRWHYGNVGEIDIVARQGKEWVFIEVRARRNAEPGAALESIGKRKQAQIARLAQAYLNQHKLGEVAWRIDIVAITFLRGQPALVDIVENAVGW